MWRVSNEPLGLSPDQIKERKRPFGAHRLFSSFLGFEHCYTDPKQVKVIKRDALYDRFIFFQVSSLSTRHRELIYRMVAGTKDNLMARLRNWSVGCQAGFGN